MNEVFLCSKLASHSLCWVLSLNCDRISVLAEEYSRQCGHTCRIPKYLAWTADGIVPVYTNSRCHGHPHRCMIAQNRSCYAEIDLILLLGLNIHARGDLCWSLIIHQLGGILQSIYQQPTFRWNFHFFYFKGNCTSISEGVHKYSVKSAVHLPT